MAAVVQFWYLWYQPTTISAHKNHPWKQQLTLKWYTSETQKVTQPRNNSPAHNVIFKKDGFITYENPK